LPLAGALHGCPQSPQLLVLVCTSTQVPSHFWEPAPHAKLQVESAQTGRPSVGLGQRIPQAPQCSASLVRSTQADEQFDSPAAQLSAHLPFEQTSPAAQVVSQSPQWVGSVPGSTHPPSQLVNGSRHVVRQVPASQLATLPPFWGQAWPQAPQFCASPPRSTQTLPHGA